MLNQMINIRCDVHLNDRLLLLGFLGDRQRDLLVHPGLREEDTSKEGAVSLPQEGTCQLFTAKETPKFTFLKFNFEDEATA